MNRSTCLANLCSVIVKGSAVNSPLACEDSLDKGLMHEVAIMTEAVQMALAAAQESGATRVTRVRLRVGELSGAVPEAMQFAWEVVRRDTAAATATLEIQSVTPVGWCSTCRLEFECRDYMNACPHCDQPSRELRQGRELDISAVEVE